MIDARVSKKRGKTSNSHCNLRHLRSVRALIRSASARTEATRRLFSKPTTRLDGGRSTEVFGAPLPQPQY